MVERQSVVAIYAEWAQTAKLLHQSMITGEIRNKFDQMTYLLFIKGLDEAQARKEKPANLLRGIVEDPIFPEGEFENPVTEMTVPHESLRWSRFINHEPRAMHERISGDVFPFIKPLGSGQFAFATHMKDA